jgi:branched-chain amino acid transport system permease protein
MGILNLAHGALYMIAAYVGWSLSMRYELNFVLAVLGGGLAAGLVGFLIERGFLRRLYKQLNEQVLVTFGFVYIITNLSLWLWGPLPQPPYTAKALSFSIPLVGWSYPIARLVIILIGLGIAVVLWWLQEKTRIGAIIRAGMDNKQMTMGLGINVDRVSAIVFFFGAFMAGFAGVIGAQLLGPNLELGVEVLLLSLIVVVVGGMGSVQGALLGGVLIGLIDSFGKALFPQLAMFTMYLAMIIILLLRPHGLLGRKVVMAGGAALGLMKRARQGKGVRIVPYIVSGIVLIVLPLFLSPYLQDMMSKFIIFAILAMSLDLVFGYTGLLCLGQAAYFGVGGYVSGILIVRYGVENFWVTASCGILSAGLLAAVFGVVALRVSGIYFLLVTFALGQLLFSVATKWYSMTGGSDGTPGIPLPDLGLSWFQWNSAYFYYFVLIACAICFFILRRLITSPFGRALQGIREHEDRMQCLGYNVWLYKYVAFIVGGLFAGVAGVLFAHFNGLMAPMHLGIPTSALAMLMVIIGSVGTLYGAVIGAGVIIFVEHFASVYTPERWPLILGAVFIASIMYFRAGIGVYLIGLLNRASYGSVKS